MLGLTRFKTPSEAALSRVFRSIDATVFEELISQWIQARLGGRRFEHVAIDGKTARGSRRQDLPAVHFLAAYASEMGAVLSQLQVDAKTNEQAAALELLGVLSVKGKVVTGDAIYPHRDVCAEIGRRDGDYVLPVKDNQPTLLADIRSVLDAPPAGLSPPTETTSRREYQDGQSCR